MTPYCMVLLLSFPIIKILIFCALSYLPHSYAPFNTLETVWFSVFISGFCTITRGQESSLCRPKKFLYSIAWSSNCLEKGAKWQYTYKKFALKTILQPEILGLQIMIWNLGISYLLLFRVSQHSSKSINFYAFMTRVTNEKLIVCTSLKSNRQEYHRLSF